MLAGPQLEELEQFAFGERRKGGLIDFVVGITRVVAYTVDRNEARELDHRTGGAEGVGRGAGSVARPAPDIDGGLVEDGVCHLGGDEALPDQLVEAVLVEGRGIA